MIARCNGCPNRAESCGLYQEERIKAQYKLNGQDFRVFTECKLKNPKEREGCCTACGARRTFQDRDVID